MRFSAQPDIFATILRSRSIQSLAKGPTTIPGMGPVAEFVRIHGARDVLPALPLIGAGADTECNQATGTHGRLQRLAPKSGERSKSGATADSTDAPRGEHNPPANHDAARDGVK